jgi:uncharacterized protein YjiS (DUF1127 family)
MTTLNNAASHVTVTMVMQRRLRFLKRIGRLLNRWIAAALAERARQVDVCFLRHLSDRELKDIGINRGDLDAGLAEAAKYRDLMQQSSRFCRGQPFF